MRLLLILLATEESSSDSNSSLSSLLLFVAGSLLFLLECASSSSNRETISTGIKTCFLLRACPLLLIDEDATVVDDVVAGKTTEVGVAVDFLAITTGVGDEDTFERALPPDW